MEHFLSRFLQTNKIDAVICSIWGDATRASHSWRFGIDNGRSQKIVPKNNIILKVPLDRQDHNGPSRFFPIVACRGGPGSAARCGGGPRGTQQLIKFFGFGSPEPFTKIFWKRSPRENITKTLRKPHENLPKTLRKPRDFGN